MISYIKKHWQGEYSLRVSFWGNYIGINFLISFIYAFVILNLLYSDQIRELDRYLMNYYLISFGISLWQAVGVYKSANYYEKDTGKKLFPWVAKMLTLFSAGYNLLSFFSIQMLTPEEYQEMIDRLLKLTNI